MHPGGLHLLKGINKRRVARGTFREVVPVHRLAYAPYPHDRSVSFPKHQDADKRHKTAAACFKYPVGILWTICTPAIAPYSNGMTIRNAKQKSMNPCRKFATDTDDAESSCGT
jgi:hypothetical protein